MIVQDSGEDNLLLTRQTDHARLSGAFAAAWGSEALPPLEHGRQIMCAATRHDDGWAEWELSPKLDADGRPADFIRVDVEEHVTLYRRGIDLVELEDPYAGLLVSMHGERLYTRPFAPGLDPRIERLEGRDLELASEFVRYEHERQAILSNDAVDSLGGPLAVGDLPAEAEEGWRLLQVWDRLSLYVCLEPLTASWERTLPPVRGVDHDDVEIHVRSTGQAELLLDPYPFRRPSITFEVEGFALESGWDDERSFREAFRLAARSPVRFLCRPG